MYVIVSGTVFYVGNLIRDLQHTHRRVCWQPSWMSIDLEKFNVRTSMNTYHHRTRIEIFMYQHADNHGEKMPEASGTLQFLSYSLHSWSSFTVCRCVGADTVDKVWMKYLSQGQQGLCVIWFEKILNIVPPCCPSLTAMANAWISGWSLFLVKYILLEV